jgi:hypothetical protein
VKGRGTASNDAAAISGRRRTAAIHSNLGMYDVIRDVEFKTQLKLQQHVKACSWKITGLIPDEFTGYLN